MFSKNHPIVIFLDRSGFMLYQDFLSDILQFHFIEDLVKHSDVVNKQQLINLIQSVIALNKIVPSSMIVVLSDSVVFQKESQQSLQHSEPSLQGSQLDQNFIENIPFEDVLAKVIKLEGRAIITAVNRELLETVLYPFRKQGCIIEAVVPGFLYGQTIDFTQGLTRNVAFSVLRSRELLKEGNLLTDHKSGSATDNLGSYQKPKEKPKNIRQYFLLGIFIFLLVILGIMYAITITP